MPREKLTPKPRVTLILDSGAYSAWRLKSPIKIERYCEFLEANLDWLGPYVALDEIMPGDPEAAATASMKNLEFMLERGLDPMPVFHVGEDMKWLKRIIDMGCKYICLSASSITTRGSVDPWYEQCWNHLVNSDGLPIVKAHALGEGRLESLRRYPWYSADSASWLYAAQRTAKATLPDGGRVSVRKDGLSTKAAQDVRLMAEADREVLADYLASEGLKVDALEQEGIVSCTVRSFIEARRFMKIEKQVNVVMPIRWQPQGFLRSDPWYPNREAADFDEFHLHLVIGGNLCAYSALAKAGSKNALASYFHVGAPTNKKAMSKETEHRVQVMKEFISDPAKAVHINPLYTKYWDALKEVFVDEEQ